MSKPSINPDDPSALRLSAAAFKQQRVDFFAMPLFVNAA
jgi:hypothetical protein